MLRQHSRILLQCSAENGTFYIKCTGRPKGEPPLFADDPVGPFMADHPRAFCVDFSAGSRYKQRRLNHEPPFHGRLAAMRWPERELVYDADAPQLRELAEVDLP